MKHFTPSKKNVTVMLSRRRATWNTHHLPQGHRSFQHNETSFLLVSCSSWWYGFFTTRCLLTLLVYHKFWAYIVLWTWGEAIEEKNMDFIIYCVLLSFLRILDRQDTVTFSDKSRKSNLLSIYDQNFTSFTNMTIY